DRLCAPIAAEWAAAARDHIHREARMCGKPRVSIGLHVDQIACGHRKSIKVRSKRTALRALRARRRKECGAGDGTLIAAGAKGGYEFEGSCFAFADDDVLEAASEIRVGVVRCIATVRDRSRTEASRLVQHL